MCIWSLFETNYRGIWYHRYAVQNHLLQIYLVINKMLVSVYHQYIEWNKIWTPTHTIWNMLSGKSCTLFSTLRRVGYENLSLSFICSVDFVLSTKIHCFENHGHLRHLWFKTPIIKGTMIYQIIDMTTNFMTIFLMIWHSVWHNTWSVAHRKATAHGDVFTESQARPYVYQGSLLNSIIWNILEFLQWFLKGV